MKSIKAVLVLSAAGMLGGCVAEPVDPGYSEEPGYYGEAGYYRGPGYYAPAPAHYYYSGRGWYRGWR